jgi:hypothetical protein
MDPFKNAFWLKAVQYRRTLHHRGLSSRSEVWYCILLNDEAECRPWEFDQKSAQILAALDAGEPGWAMQEAS